MTYQPKFQKCPYRTSDCKCTHRDRKLKVTSKRKRSCGYNDVNECEMYDEWLELKKSCERAYMDELDYDELQCEY